MAKIQSLAERYVRELRKGQQRGDFSSVLSLFVDEAVVVTPKVSGAGKEPLTAYFKSIPLENISIFVENPHPDRLSLRLSSTDSHTPEPYLARMILYLTLDGTKFTELQVIESPTVIYWGG